MNTNRFYNYVPDQHLNDGLKTYTVIREDALGGWDYFVCEAEDVEHADEQSINADPEYPILWINRGLNFSMEDVYRVTITATVTKTYEVNASSEEEAIEEAIGVFSVLADGTPENYEEEIVLVEKVEYVDE